MSFFASPSSRPAADELAAATGPVIALRDLERSYDTAAGRSWVLRRINLDVARGEFLTIMGPSGAGKSTLLAILGMLDHEWRG